MTGTSSNLSAVVCCVPFRAFYLSFTSSLPSLSSSFKDLARLSISDPPFLFVFSSSWLSLTFPNLLFAFILFLLSSFKYSIYPTFALTYLHFKFSHVSVRLSALEFISDHISPVIIFAFSLRFLCLSVSSLNSISFSCYHVQYLFHTFFQSFFSASLPCITRCLHVIMSRTTDTHTLPADAMMLFTAILISLHELVCAA